jgi:hypothetical protein
MASVKTYVQKLWTVHKTVSRKLGADVSWGSIDSRVNALTTDVIVACLVKTLTDKGLVTDAELQAVFNAVASADFPAQPNTVEPVDGGSPPDPDLGG